MSQLPSAESLPTPSEASSTESSLELTQEEIDKQQKKNEKKTKENEKLKKKLKNLEQKNGDEEFLKNLENARINDENVINIWNGSTREQRNRVFNLLNDALMLIIRKDTTNLDNFITKLNSLNENMRSEINDVFENENYKNDEINISEKLKKTWKKHKPFIVRSRGEVLEDDGHSEMKVRKCALNFGAHRCVYHFLPFDKKKIYKQPEVAGSADDNKEAEEKEDEVAEKADATKNAATPNVVTEGAAENLSPEIEDTKPKKNTINIKKEKKNKDSIPSELKRCKQYTKVVGIDLDFYRYVDPDSLVAKTIEAAIESKNIKDTKGRQYFCDKHLKQLVGLVPRQIDGDSLAYHLIATQPFYEGDYVATFSQIKYSTELNLQDKLRISPVSYFKSNQDDPNDIVGTLDDTCFKDLGDYITDPNADNVFDMYLKKDQEELKKLFDCFEGKCNVEIELKEVNKKNKICLKATRTIYKNEIIYLNFGIDYWKNYLKFNIEEKKYEPAIKSDLRYYKNLASYNTLKSSIDKIKDKYVDLLLMDTTDITYFQEKKTAVDSVPKKKLSLNRLNNLYKHHFQINKQTK